MSETELRCKMSGRVRVKNTFFGEISSWNIPKMQISGMAEDLELCSSCLEIRNKTFRGNGSDLFEFLLFEDIF